MSKNQNKELTKLQLLISASFDNPLNVLFLIETLGTKATGPYICDLLECQRSTFNRRKRTLRDEFGVKLTFHADPYMEGKGKGFYTVDDCGGR